MNPTALALSSILLAYIGPGGGIGLLGPLLGVIVAVICALAMVALWPVRYLLRKSRANGSTQRATDSGEPQPQN